MEAFKPKKRAMTAFYETVDAWLTETGMGPTAICLPTKLYLRLAWELGLRDPKGPVRNWMPEPDWERTFASEQPFMQIQRMQIGSQFMFNGCIIREEEYHQ